VKIVKLKLGLLMTKLISGLILMERTGCLLLKVVVVKSAATYGMNITQAWQQIFTGLKIERWDEE
jgi:hypothetical protein